MSSGIEGSDRSGARRSIGLLSRRDVVLALGYAALLTAMGAWLHPVLAWGVKNDDYIGAATELLREVRAQLQAEVAQLSAALNESRSQTRAQAEISAEQAAQLEGLQSRRLVFRRGVEVPPVQQGVLAPGLRLQ